jgi:molybdenum cofactor cytidylyltransferase
LNSFAALPATRMPHRTAIVVLATGPRPGDGAAQAAGAGPLGQTVARALQTRLPVVVVTTADRVPAVAHLVAGRDCVVLPPTQAAQGWGRGFAAGVAERASASGWLLLPGDMPQVQPSTLLAVAHGLRGHAVAFAQYRGRRGYPLGFSAELYSELMGLQGDEGARRLVARYPGYAAEVDDPGVQPDSDAALEVMAVPSRFGATP